MGRNEQNKDLGLEVPLEERKSSTRCGGFLNVAFVLAFGAVCGIGIFHSIFYQKFSELLLETEFRHNETLEVLKARLDFAISEKNECLDDDTKDAELGALRARLSLNGNVASEYEKLLEQYDNLVGDIDELEDKYDRLLEKEEDLTYQLKEYQSKMQVAEESRAEEVAEKEKIQAVLQRQNRDLEAMASENNQLDGVIQKQKRILETMSEEKKRLMDNVRRTEELDNNLAQCENEAIRVRSGIQERQKYLSKEEYGKGPYYVQFTLKSQLGVDPMSFVVELASRKLLPHAVFTFLSLVEYQLYDGTILSLRDDGSMVTSTANEEHEGVLTKKLRTLGMEEFVLMFPEASSQFPCNENSIGFDWLGPSVEIYLDPRNQNAEFKSCFGKVVRGFEALAAARKYLSEGQQIDVVQARHLEL